MTTLFSRALFLALALFAVHSSAVGEPQRKGHGGHGRLSETDRGVIHQLFESHDAIVRTVETTEDGYRASTTSKDPKVAQFLKDHVAAMKKRLAGGAGVRNWDPAFVEFRQHYQDMSVEVTEREDGISVAVKGSSPEAIEVARNHASIITGFVDKGSVQMHASHPVALREEGEKGASPSSGKCPSCGSGGEKGKSSCRESCKTKTDATDS